MTKYDLYKPFRNIMRQFPLEESLIIVWHYIQHVSIDHALPPELHPRDRIGRPFDLHRMLFQWELEVLTRELFLNAPVAGNRTFRNWNQLTEAINWIKSLSDQMDPADADGFDVMREIHRIAHRQFPWQRQPSSADMVRYYKIYGGPELSSLVEQAFEMKPKQLMQVAFGVSSRFLSHYGLLRTQSYASLGISDEKRDAFLSRVSTSLADLRKSTRDAQRYDRDWAYAYNLNRPWIAGGPNS